MAIVLPQGKQQFFDSNGDPLAGGKLYTYQPGPSVTTPKTTHQDAAGTIANTNPIILNARGEALVFWSGGYNVRLETAAGGLIYTVENINIDPSPASLDAALRADLAASTGSALIGFQQSGVSTVPRTAFAKISERLSFEDLGAIGDGVADDGATLTAALYARYSGLATSQSQVFVQIEGTPGKTYKFATPVTIRQNRILLIGNGASIVCTGAYAFDVTQDGSGNGNEEGAISGWKITGATVAAIRGRAASFWDITDNWITGCADGIDWNGIEPYISNNYIRDNSGVGLKLQSHVSVGNTATSSATSIGPASAVMTVGGTLAGRTFVPGMMIVGAGITPGTYIVSNGTGTGGAGTYNVNFSQTAAATSVTGTMAGETQRPIVKENRIWVNGAGGMHFIDVVGAYVVGNDFEVNQVFDVRLQRSLGNYFVANYGEPTTGVNHIQLDNTLGLSPARTCDTNVFIGWFMGGGATWDIDIQGGNTNVFQHFRLGDRNIRIGVGCSNNVLDTFVGADPILTNAGTNTINRADLQKIGGIKSISTGTSLGNNRNGTTTIPAGTLVHLVTFPTAEPDANYKVTGLVCSDSTGAPAAGSFKGRATAKGAGGFSITLDTAVAVGASVTFDWAIER